MSHPLSSKYSIDTLRYIGAHPGCTKNDVCWYVASPSKSSYKLLCTLADAGLIVIDGRKHARNRKLLSLTPNGWKLLVTLNEVLPPNEEAVENSKTLENKAL